MLLPPLTAVMTFYLPSDYSARYECAKQTLMSWSQYLDYAGEIQVVIADDTPTPELQELSRELDSFHRWKTTVVHTGGKGVGGALNAGFALAFETSPLVLYADDSYQLRSRLDLTPWAKILLKHDGTDSPNNIIRNVGGISLWPPRTGLRGGELNTFSEVGDTGIVSTVRFERYSWVWCGCPMLYHKRLIDHFGGFVEGTNAFDWETLTAQRYEGQTGIVGGPDIHHACYNPWQHVFTIELGGVGP